MKQWVTVAEYATITGKSRQTVYKALNKRLKPYVTTVDNVKMININALSEIEGIKGYSHSTEKATRATENDNQTTTGENGDPTAWATLIEQLRVKDEHISQLTERLNQALQIIQATQVISIQAAQASNIVEPRRDITPDPPDETAGPSDDVITNDPIEPIEEPPATASQIETNIKTDEPEERPGIIKRLLNRITGKKQRSGRVSLHG